MKFNETDLKLFFCTEVSNIVWQIHNALLKIIAQLNKKYDITVTTTIKLLKSVKKINKFNRDYHRPHQLNKDSRNFIPKWY